MQYLDDYDDEITGEKIIKKFDRKITNLKVYGLIEKNVFNLVDDYFNGKYDGDIDEVSMAVAIDTLTSSNEEDKYAALIDTIGNSIEKIKGKINICSLEKLENKLKNAKSAYFDLAAINRACSKELEEVNKYKYKEKNKIKATYNSMYNDIEIQLNYLLIELFAALNLPMECFDYSMIRNYCESIITDVNSNKYETLGFSKHLDANGNI